MTYYINPIWFYLMNLSEGIKTLLMVFGIIAVSISVFAFIIVSFITLFIGIFLPSKETCIEMMIASQVTHENVAATKEEIYELVDYVTEKVRSDE